MSFLDNYEDVAARIQRFWATHPSGIISIEEARYLMGFDNGI